MSNVTRLKGYTPRRNRPARSGILAGLRSRIASIPSWLMSPEGYQETRGFVAGLIVGLTWLVLSHLGGK